MAEKTTTPATPAKTATKPSGNVAAFKSCVAGGGKVTVATNADGTITETCTLGGQSFSDAPKKPAATAPPAKTPFPPKAKADMEKATAAVKFTKVEVTSDGTAKGTTIKVNGAAIANLESFSFRHYAGSLYYPVEMSYTTRQPDAKPGELNSYTTYSLRCPQPSGAYASRGMASAVASVQGAAFEVATAAADPLARPVVTTPADYAKAFK